MLGSVVVSGIKRQHKGPYRGWKFAVPTFFDDFDVIFKFKPLHFVLNCCLKHVIPGTKTYQVMRTFGYALFLQKLEIPWNFMHFWCLFIYGIENTVRSQTYKQLRFFWKRGFVENKKLNNFCQHRKIGYPWKKSSFCYILDFGFVLSARARARARRRSPASPGAGRAPLPPL